MNDEEKERAESAIVAMMERVDVVKIAGDAQSEANKRHGTTV